MVPSRDQLALEYIRLISPLIPPGHLCVRFVGTPLRDRDVRAHSALVQAAARVRAHRTKGIATLEVRFNEPGEPTTADHADLIVRLDDLRVSDRCRRLVVMTGLFMALLVALRAHRSRGRDLAYAIERKLDVRGRLAVTGENIRR